jgi:hypothetical protein
VHFTLGSAAGEGHLAPVERALLAPFQLALRRHQLLSLRLRAGHTRSRFSDRGPQVPPTLRQRWSATRNTDPVDRQRPAPGAQHRPFHSPEERSALFAPWRHLRRRPVPQRNRPW